MPVSLFRLPARPARRSCLGLELLDDRSLPNGTIVASLTSGTFTMTGDDNANVATIKVTGAGITITPDANTAINQSAAGAPVTLNGAVTSMKVNLLGGDDTLSIDGASDFTISKSVSI